MCSHCGNRKHLNLTDRTYCCECGLELDRDINAALNIKNEGLRILMSA
ncbi:zinc ribbon domain-containing protein [Granulicatella balaenopterae]